MADSTARVLHLIAQQPTERSRMRLALYTLRPLVSSMASYLPAGEELLVVFLASMSEVIAAGLTPDPPKPG